MMEIIRITEISQCTSENVQRIKELLQQLSEQTSFDEDDLEAILVSEGSHLFFVYVDEVVAGMLTLGSYRTPTGPKYWIEDVVVDTCNRGRSFVRMLVEHAIGFVKEKNDGGILMLTSRPSRVAANALYQSVGFETKQTNVYKMLFPKKSNE